MTEMNNLTRFGKKPEDKDSKDRNEMSYDFEN